MARPPASDRRRSWARFRPIVASLEARALMAFAGGLDPTFGGGNGFFVGPVTVEALGGRRRVRELPNPTTVAVEADGSIVVAVPDGMTSSQTFAVSHLKADGTLDTSFGTAGKADVALPVGFFAFGGPTDLLVQPDGKIVVVGQVSSGGRLAPGSRRWWRGSTSMGRPRLGLRHGRRATILDQAVSSACPRS